MSIRFNADEMFRIAEQIEINGAHFYYQAAGLVSPEAANELRQLSQWEMTHAERFAAMRHALTDTERESTAYDPNDELALYLQAVADGTVFKLEDDPAAVLGSNPSVADVLKAAIAKEHESIEYYTGMRQYLSPKLGKGQIDEIINEELRHIVILRKQMAALTCG